MPKNKPVSRKMERHIPLAELAKKWQISVKTLEKMFTAEQADSLRVPESVVRRVYEKFKNK